MHIHLSEPFAVLVRRGTCPFGDKVRNAQSSGAAAVLIGDSLESMYEPTLADGVPQLKSAEGGACLVHCDMGRSLISNVSIQAADSGFRDSACAQSPACTSGICGVTGLLTALTAGGGGVRIFFALCHNFALFSANAVMWSFFSHSVALFQATNQKLDDTARHLRCMLQFHGDFEGRLL